MHISISLQQHKKAKAAAEEHSGKERRRIDELEAIQVREIEAHNITKGVLGQRETRPKVHTGFVRVEYDRNLFLPKYSAEYPTKYSAKTE